MSLKCVFFLTITIVIINFSGVDYDGKLKLNLFLQLDKKGIIKIIRMLLIHLQINFQIKPHQRYYHYLYVCKIN